MNIIVIGAGQLGVAITEQLVKENHDVTVIDTNADKLSSITQDFDVMGIEGNGANTKILEDAGVKSCDIAIALTGSDELNLICCLLAKKLGAYRTIARVRNPEYSEQFTLIRESLDISLAVNPEKEAANEIARILRTPSAMNVEVFAKGNVELISFSVEENTKICDKSLKEAFSGMSVRCLVCGVERNQEAVIPTGDFVIRKGDVIAVITAHNDVPDMFRSLGIQTNNIKKVMIIGASKIAYYLAQELIDHKIKVTVVEKDRTVAENLSVAVPKVNVICGDGTDASLLMEEGFMSTDAICTLTGLDEENVIMSMYARKTKKDIKAITKIKRMTFNDVLSAMDLGTKIFPKFIATDSILQYVRSKEDSIGSKVENFYRIFNNQVEAMEFLVKGGSHITDQPLSSLKIKKGVLIGCITRQDEIIIPNGNDIILEGDRVVIVTTRSGLSVLEDIME